MITDWIKRLVSRGTAGDHGADLADIAPARPFYVVGDIHGRLDLLETLLDQLKPDHPVVFVGDYIDRGGQAAQVLNLLQDLSNGSPQSFICLLGNHEEMMLRFIDDPKRMGGLWLHNGGLQTLASFGLSDVTEPVSGADAIALASRLRETVGEPLLSWLRNRPLTWTSGNVTAVHAAFDPALPLKDQTREVCLWGHPRFFLDARTDGQWVIHGHTIVATPRIYRQVISVDTGAFATDRLTAAEIRPGEINFHTTGETSGNPTSE